MVVDIVGPSTPYKGSLKTSCTLFGVYGVYLINVHDLIECAFLYMRLRCYYDGESL